MQKGIHEEKLAAGALWTENCDRIIHTKMSKTVQYANALWGLHYICDLAGITRISPHQLRHNYATRLVTAGVHPRVAQELLGHEDITMTMKITVK